MLFTIAPPPHRKCCINTGYLDIFSIVLVSEVGSIDTYPTHKKFTAYCGCCERVVNSAGKDYSAHILHRSNKHLRCILFNAAKTWCYIYKEKSVMKDYCKRLFAKKGSKSFKLVC
ncbi:MAG: transposase [Promethearchaeota archaeon]